MKRYTELEIRNTDGESMVPAIDGEWVRYDDVAKLIAAAEYALNVTLPDHIEQLRNFCDFERDSNYGKVHIAQRALEEIERLRAALEGVK